MISFRQCSPASLAARYCALFMLWFSSHAWAVTLGQESILSALGDPIEVEIELLQWDDIDLGQVEIALASRDEYDAFGLGWLPTLAQLDFNLIGPDLRGAVKVLVSTREPVVEPYVELLLVLRWPGGSLLREYVLLFDLPVVRSAVSLPAEVEAPAVPEVVAAAEELTVAVTVADSDNTSAVEPRNQGAIVVDNAVPLPAAQAAAAPASGRRVYQVREGDGLWSIAQQFQPAGAGDNLYQMLLSLHDLNRAAFINGNISLLKANALLQIPGTNDIEAVPADTAESLFEQRWAEGTRRLQTALRGEPLPAFSELYQSERSEAGPEAAQQARVPGQETGRVAGGNDGLLLPATTTVVVLESEESAANDGIAFAEPVLQLSQLSTAASAGKALADADSTAAITVNPYLERIDGTARDLQVLLQNRAAQIARLEEQLLEMRGRMRDAQQVTARLNAALELALERQGQTQQQTLATALLGMLALVLLAALVVALVMLLRLTMQVRQQRRALAGADAFDEVPLPAAATGERANQTREGLPSSDGIVVHEQGDVAALAADDQDELRPAPRPFVSK
jgi:pilus assembly protein FimV